MAVECIRNRVGAAIDHVNRAKAVSEVNMSYTDWHKATDLLGRDDAIVEVADQLGDQRVLVTKTCAGYIVWIKGRC